MRRFLLFLLLFALIFSAFWASEALPQPANGLAAEKYEGFSGVLHVRLTDGACSALPGVVRWFNECAAVFEKRHPGVYLRLQTGEMHFDADLCLFLPGEIASDGLLPLSVRASGAFSDVGMSDGIVRACPLTCGGSILAVSGEPPEALADVSAGIYAGSEAAWLSICAETESRLGRETVVPGERSALYSQLLNGELTALPLNHSLLIRLLSRQSDGKSEEIRLTAAAHLTDQVLYAAVPRTLRDDANARAALSEEFLSFLLTDACQEKLKDRRLISVTGLPLYMDDSALSRIEAAVRAPDCIIRGAFDPPITVSAEELFGETASPRERIRELRNHP